MIVPIILSLAFSFAPDEASQRYLDCLNLIEADIQTGRRAAQLWAAEGGAADAEHCLALADISAGFLKLGAARLEAIASRKDAGDDYVRARLLAQSAETWMNAGNFEQAASAIVSAFELAPDSGELHLTAARVHAANGAQQKVVAAITSAEQAGFFSLNGYLLRGRANLQLGDTEAAAIDVVSALSINPTNVDALTLRGDVQRAGVVIDVSITPRPPADHN